MTSTPTVVASLERWEHYPHGADIGVRGIGPTPESAFEQAALALTAVVTDPLAVRPLERVLVALEEPDLELLLVKWLNSVVFEMAVRRMLFGRFAVRLDGAALRAELWGEPIDRARHTPAVEVKGATVTDLRVEPRPDGTWIAGCILDV